MARLLSSGSELKWWPNHRLTNRFNWQREQQQQHDNNLLVVVIRTDIRRRLGWCWNRLYRSLAKISIRKLTQAAYASIEFRPIINTAQRAWPAPLDGQKENGLDAEWNRKRVRLNEDENDGRVLESKAGWPASTAQLASGQRARTPIPSRAHFSPRLTWFQRLTLSVNFDKQLGLPTINRIN